MMNTVEKGTRFELQVKNYIEQQIALNNFPVSKNHKVFLQKEYFSNARQSYIKFDVTIEEYLDGFDDFYRITIIECKDYKRNVEVGKIEEFYLKCKQVADLKCKAIFVSTSNVSVSAHNALKTYGIGFIRFLNVENQFRPILPRKSSNNLTYQPQKKNNQNTSNFDINKASFKGYLNHKISLEPKVFFYELFNVKHNIELVNTNNTLETFFLFQLEEISEAVLKDNGYIDGAFDIEKLLIQLAKNLDYTIIYRFKNDSEMLAYVDFEQKLITFHINDEVNIQQARFTMAHEASHLILKHDAYLLNDIFKKDDKKFFALSEKDFQMLESQANYLAACLLVPRNVFIPIFNKLVADNKDRGFGKVFVDNQPCNIAPFLKNLAILSNYFNVSKSVIEYRLKDLNLINDGRS